MLLKNTFIFYVLIVSPLLILFQFHEWMGSTVFLVSLALYVLVYRPIVDGVRLKVVAGIPSDELRKLYIPFYGHVRYFKELYLPHRNNQ